MRNILLFILLIGQFSVAQNAVKNQLSFIMDNDKLVLTDKYYTSGLFLDYKRVLANDFLFFKAEKGQLQLEFLLSNETYTPTNLRSTNVLKFDRPYAGWSSLTSSLKQVKEHQSHTFAFEFGLTGQLSGAGQMQTWWHTALGIDRPTWTQEISNKFLINLKSLHLYNFNLTKHSAILYKLQRVLGLKDISLENNVSLYIGLINPFASSVRSGVVSVSKEFYGHIGLGYKYVAHNALIQGDLNYNDKTFTTAITPHLLNANFGLVYKSEKHLWQLSMLFNTKETLKSTSHNYGRFSYGFLF